MVEDGFKILQTEQEGGSVIKHFSGEINVIRVPVEKIQANPYQPRKDFEPEALEDPIRTSPARILSRKRWKIWRLRLPNTAFCSRCWLHAAMMITFC